MSGETVNGTWNWNLVEFLKESHRGGTEIHFASGKQIWSPKVLEVLIKEWDSCR